MNYVGPVGPDVYRLSVVSPPSRGDVHITALTQDASSTPSADNLFKYVDPPPPGPPEIVGVDAAHGSVVGGDIIRIIGRDIGDANEVKFGAVAAESFAVKVTDQGVTIDAISPCGLQGIIPVTVTTRRGTSAIIKASEYRYSLPTILGTVSFGARTVGAAGAPMTATIPLKLSLSDLPQDTVITPSSLGNSVTTATLQTILQAAGLGAQFTVGQFIAAFGNATVEYTVSELRLRRGDGRDFSVQAGGVAANALTVSINFVPIAKGYRADVLRARVGGIRGSGTGFAGFAASLAGTMADYFSGTISEHLALLLEGTGI